MAPGDPTLREHLEALIVAERELREAEERNYDLRLQSAQREIDRRFEAVEEQSDRIGRVEKFVENITGRMIAFGVLGAIFVAVAASVITRLIIGGG